MPFRYQSVQTNYGGTYFRSKLEARWAAFFDAYGLQWHYEAESFDLPSGTYIPDFWLSSLNVWVEVKPEYQFADTDRYKELVQQVEGPFILIVGQPNFGQYCIRYFAVEENENLGLILQGQFAQLNDNKRLWVADTNIGAMLRSGSRPNKIPKGLVHNSAHIVKCMEQANMHFDLNKEAARRQGTTGSTGTDHGALTISYENSIQNRDFYCIQ
ncbi:MAG: hypothetical protein JST89_23130 [Cyanobacteria bacterium SZAS-4]|nr:hypothetical protein [Cyanobacteria bacterium SZAS-4]